MAWNEVHIKPKDYKGWVNANAIKIREEFKNMGFTNVNAFVNIVTEHALDDFGTYKAIKDLEKFWHGRHHREDFNRSLEMVLERLKAE